MKILTAFLLGGVLVSVVYFSSTSFEAVSPSPNMDVYVETDTMADSGHEAHPRDV